MCGGAAETSSVPQPEGVQAQADGSPCRRFVQLMDFDGDVRRYSRNLLFAVLFLQLGFVNISSDCHVPSLCAAAEGQIDCLLLLVNMEQSADIIDNPDTQGQ